MRNAIVSLAAFPLIIGAARSGLADEKKAPPVDPSGSHQVILLWPDGAPGAVGSEDADRPTLTVYLPPPDKATGGAVVVCPGGGYRVLAPHEGQPVAEWLNTLGVRAFVLKYRLAPRYHHPAPLQDAARAVRLVRARAGDWNIDPHRVGILGFSAGGHLGATLGTHFDESDAGARDPVERASSRPDLMVLIYPAISFTADFVPKGIGKMLLGDDPKPELLDELSAEKHVTAQTPPAFLVHTSEDSCEHSLVFALALRKAKVPVELHLYEKGKHGYGLAAKEPILSTWTAHCADWLGGRGFLKKGP
jgi:acetyl esterase/lipase